MLSAVLESRMLSCTAAVLINTSHAGTRPLAVLGGHQPKDTTPPARGQQDPNGVDARAGEEGDDPVDRLGGIGRVEGREHQVPGIRRFHAPCRACLESRISPIRITSGSCRNTCRRRRLERQRVAPDLTLRDVGLHVPVEKLDRILDRDDVAAPIVVDVIDHRRKRRRLPDPVTPVTRTSPRLQARSSQSLGEAKFVDRS